MEIEFLQWMFDQGGLAAIAIVSILVIKFIHKERIQDLKDNAAKHAEHLERVNTLSNKAFDALDRNSTVMNQLVIEIKKLSEFHFSQIGELLYDLREKDRRERKEQ